MPSIVNGGLLFPRKLLGVDTDERLDHGAKSNNLTLRSCGMLNKYVTESEAKEEALVACSAEKIFSFSSWIFAEVFEEEIMLCVVTSRLSSHQARGEFWMTSVAKKSSPPRRYHRHRSLSM